MPRNRNKGQAKHVRNFLESTEPTKLAAMFRRSVLKHRNYFPPIVVQIVERNIQIDSLDEICRVVYSTCFASYTMGLVACRTQTMIAQTGATATGGGAGWTGGLPGGVWGTPSNLPEKLREAERLVTRQAGRAVAA